MRKFKCRECGEDLEEKVAAALRLIVDDFRLRGEPTEDNESKIVEVVCSKDHANSFRLISSTRP